MSPRCLCHGPWKDSGVVTFGEVYREHRRAEAMPNSEWVLSAEKNPAETQVIRIFHDIKVAARARPPQSWKLRLTQQLSG